MIGVPVPSYHQGFARNASESAYPGLWRGLQGAWMPALGVTGQDTLRDVSGRGMDGTMVGTMTTADWVITDPQRGPWWALDYDNTDDYIDLGNIGDLGDQFTFCVWFNTDSITGNLAIFVYRTDDSDAKNLIQLDRNVAQLRFLCRGTDNIISKAETGSDFLVVNTWYRAVGRRNGNDVELFVDGNSRGSDSDAIGVITMNRLLIGALWDDDSNAAKNFFNGQIGEARVYNRCLTNDEIRLDFEVHHAPFVLREDIFLAKAPLGSGAISMAGQGGLAGMGGLAGPHGGLVG